MAKKKEIPVEDIAQREDLTVDSKAASAGSGISLRALNIIKFILGVCLLPFVYSLSAAFIKELSRIGHKAEFYFWSGVVSFLIFYLFIWEPAPLYIKGQKLAEDSSRFFQPLFKFAPYLLPIYTIILFLLYKPAALVFKTPDFANYFIFLLGFSISLHLIFSARSMRLKERGFLKAGYIFGFSFIYLIDIALLAVGLSFIFRGFSLFNFFSVSWEEARIIFSAVFQQLF